MSKNNLKISLKEYGHNPHFFWDLTKLGIDVTVFKDGKDVMLLSGHVPDDDVCAYCDFAPAKVGAQCSYCSYSSCLGPAFKKHYLKCQENFQKTFYQLVDFLEGRAQ